MTNNHTKKSNHPKKIIKIKKHVPKKITSSKNKNKLSRPSPKKSKGNKKVTIDCPEKEKKSKKRDNVTGVVV